VVQYRETAFNFISRLMEEEGIFYFFDHTKDKHTLVLADDTSAHKPFPGFEKVQYKEQEKNTVGDARLWSVLMDRSARPGSYELVDYDFKAPTKLLLSKAKTLTQKQKSGLFEVFDYPGSFYAKDEGDRYAKVRMEESDAMHEVLSMQGDVRGLSAGIKFTLEGSPISKLNREYVVVSSHFAAQIDEYGSESSPAGEGSEMIHFSCTTIPADVFYRPQRRSHKPSIAGPQTAFVTGPSGEEIHVDSFGRVKVKFLWDRHGTADDKSSCWVRVSQGWAGKKWGMMFIPRIGQEVIVEFLEGDPDRPIITGRVYNGGADGQIPYPLPDSKTVSTIKTSSSKGGAGFNEIRFEDKKGDEFVFVHAEKDLHIRVKNDRLEFIGHDRDLVVTNDKREHVKNDRSETIDRDHKEEIKRDRMLAVKGKEAVEITGSKSLTVKDDVIEDFKKNQSTKIAKDLYIKATNICIEATTNITIKVGESHIAIESDGIKIGTNGEIKVESMKDTTFESKTGKWGVKSLQDISFKSSAGNFKAEATINAEIKGTVGAKLEGKMTDVKGAMTTLSGDAMTTVKGGIVMIN
jgi:type VI secretion system secreted protein VgrG